MAVESFSKKHLISFFQGRDPAKERWKSDPLANFTDIELFRLMKCSHPEKVNTNLDEEKQKTLQTITRHYTSSISFSNQKFTQALSATLTEVPSYGIVTLFTFAGVLSSVGVIALCIGASIIMGSSILIGAFYLWTIFKELEAVKEFNKHKVALKGLKLEVLTEITKRLQGKYDPINNIMLILGETSGLERDKIEQMRTLRRILESTMVVTTTLLCTYVVTFGMVLSMIGVSFAAGLTSPVLLTALSLAFLGSAIIGCYFGYKTYLLAKQEKSLDDFQNVLDADFLEKYEEYVSLKNGIVKGQDKTFAKAPDELGTIHLASTQNPEPPPQIYSNGGHIFCTYRTPQRDNPAPEVRKNDVVGHVSALFR